jgi:hypothetical protein
MDLNADIKWIKSELNNVRDPDLILAFKNLLKYNKNKNADWWDAISDEEKEEIRNADQQIDDGNYLSHDEVMANPRKWLLK